MPGSKGRLISLREHSAEDEITVYVKGFLGPGESAEHFETWLAGHRCLEEAHGWGPGVAGWRWQSDVWSSLPLPVVSTSKLAWDLYRSAKHARLATLGTSAALGLAEVAARFVVQYAAARRRAERKAEQLAAAIDDLASRYRRVRILAHSLGCLHVIQAVARLAAEKRPDEVHLCAPACSEEEAAALLPALARETTFLYFTPADLVLSLAYPLVAGSRALGASGPRRAYPGLVARDSSEHFGFLVHGQYKRCFPELVGAALRDAAGDAVHAGAAG